MGNIYRFVEPIILVCLKKLKTAHGYQLAQEAELLTVTHTPLDVPVIYRTLRRFEELGLVTSKWDTSNPGPAKREYTLTEAGLEHLKNWGIVLDDIVGSLLKLQDTFKSVEKSETD